MNYGEPHLSWSGAGYLPQLWFLSIGSNAIDESSVSSVFLRTGMLVARKKAKNGPRRMGFGEFIKAHFLFSRQYAHHVFLYHAFFWQGVPRLIELVWLKKPHTAAYQSLGQLHAPDHDQ
jgi:hypothetical protein